MESLATLTDFQTAVLYTSWVLGGILSFLLILGIWLVHRLFSYMKNDRNVVDTLLKNSVEGFTSLVKHQGNTGKEIRDQYLKELQGRDQLLTERETQYLADREDFRRELEGRFRGWEARVSKWFQECTDNVLLDSDSEAARVMRYLMEQHQWDNPQDISLLVDTIKGIGPTSVEDAKVPDVRETLMDVLLTSDQFEEDQDLASIQGILELCRGENSEIDRGLVNTVAGMIDSNLSLADVEETLATLLGYKSLKVSPNNYENLTLGTLSPDVDYEGDTSLDVEDFGEEYDEEDTIDYEESDENPTSVVTIEPYESMRLQDMEDRDTDELFSKRLTESPSSSDEDEKGLDEKTPSSSKFESEVYEGDPPTLNN